MEIFDDNLKKYAGVLPHIIVGDSAEAASKFEDQSVDFLFIDADHSKEAVTKDIEAWLPKMKIGSVMGGHDWFHHPLQEAVKSFFHVDQVHSMGTSNIWTVNIE